MPLNAGDLIDSISRRVRDTNNTAHSRAFVRDVLDRSQTILNVHNKYVISTINFTTVPGQALYQVGSDINGIQRVTDVEQLSSRIDEVLPWRNLWKLSPTWLTDSGPIAGWAMIGKTLFAIYPTPTVATTIQLRGPAITTELNADTVPMDLRDEDTDILRDLVTAMLLFRQRDLDMLQPIMLRLIDKLGLQARDATKEEQRNG